METPEGFVPQEQHDSAMLALRAELSEAINAKQEEIDLLKTQLASLAEEASGYQQQITQLQNKIKEEQESSSALLQQAEKKRVSDLSNANGEFSAQLNDIATKAQETVNQLSRMNKALDERWQAQNNYVIALENQSVGDVRAALIAFRDAETRVQIESLTAKLNNG